MESKASIKRVRTRMGTDESTFYANGIASKKKTAVFKVGFNTTDLKEATLSQKIIAEAWIRDQDRKWNEFVKDFRKAINV